MAVYTATDIGVVINVRTIPRSSQSGVDGIVGDAVKVRVRAAPVEGLANRELIEVVAEAFGIPRSRVEFKGGETSKNKRVLLRGVPAADFERMIGAMGGKRR